MQQSPTISFEQESLSPITHNSNEYSLNKINQLDKWRQIIKRIVQFFRYIKIPSLRSRFINIVSHISTNDFQIEELNKYKTRKIQEDFLFLDDIKRYHEVFNTFSSFGFVWQDKEFQLAKLKAIYIYDHYMSTSEAISKTNIPLNTISIIYNRINSPRILSSMTYLNLFNDAEKFIMEKLLMIYMRGRLNCFSPMLEKQSIPIMNRYNGNRIITNGSISSFEHLKEINKIETPISNHSIMKLKDTIKNEPQYDEIIIPNWTYSTGLGVVYNPIIEKRVKTTGKNIQKKSKDIESNINSIMKLNHNTPNEIKRLDMNSSKSILHISSKFSPAINQQYIDNNRSNFIYEKKFLLNSTDLPSPHYSRCDGVFNKNMFDKNHISQNIFICKVHSSTRSNLSQFKIEDKIPYRMSVKPQLTFSLNKIQ